MEEEQFDVLFKEIDQDGSGKVEKPELTMLIKKMMGKKKSKSQSVKNVAKRKPSKPKLIKKLNN